MQTIIHMPWWIALALIAIGLMLVLAANRRQDKALLKIGFAVVAIAAVLGIVGLFFKTDLEKMENRTREMVTAVDRQDWNKLSTLLDDHTTLSAANQVAASGRDSIVATLKAAYQKYGVKSVWTLSVEGKQTNPLITVNVDIFSSQDYTLGEQVPSTWELVFEPSGEPNGNAWVVDSIELIRVRGQDVDHPFNPFPH